MSWITPQQAEGLAPDSGTLGRARKIAKRDKYKDIGASERAIWGVALGSSSYNSYVDLQGPAFKCSCPVKKLPCKHIMGLLLLVANEPECVTDSAHPEALQEWLNKRDSSAQAKATKAAKKASGEEVPDTEAQLKRAKQREERVHKGIQELRIFLEDIVSTGLLESSRHKTTGWERLRKRLVDAQAKGLANIVDNIRLQLGVGPDWTDRVLSQLGELYRLIQAWEQRHQLPQAQLEDLKQRIGWTVDRDEVLAGPRLEGDWVTLSQQLSYDSGLHTQEAWLIHRVSGQLAQQLSFATDHDTSGLKRGLIPGQQFQGSAAWYSQWAPQRAEFVFESLFEQQSLSHFDWLQAWASDDFRSAFQHLQAQRLRTPWPGRWPLLLNHVRLVMQQERLALLDRHQAVLQLDCSDVPESRLLALLGNVSCTLFGITQDGVSLKPLSCLIDNHWLSLVPSKEK